jgi:hypothetical protein
LSRSKVSEEGERRIEDGFKELQREREVRKTKHKKTTHFLTHILLHNETFHLLISMLSLHHQHYARNLFIKTMKMKNETNAHHVKTYQTCHSVFGDDQLMFIKPSVGARSMKQKT